MTKPFEFHLVNISRYPARRRKKFTCCGSFCFSVFILSFHFGSLIARYRYLSFCVPIFHKDFKNLIHFSYFLHGYSANKYAWGYFFIWSAVNSRCNLIVALRYNCTWIPIKTQLSGFSFFPNVRFLKGLWRAVAGKNFRPSVIVGKNSNPHMRYGCSS